eukprot:scaffold4636_cov147-Skeletonema_dohrnii-CCMP3373.AAC.1
MHKRGISSNHCPRMPRRCESKSVKSASMLHCIVISSNCVSTDRNMLHPASYAVLGALLVSH